MVKECGVFINFLLCGTEIRKQLANEFLTFIQKSNLKYTIEVSININILNFWTLNGGVLPYIHGEL